MKLQHKHHYLLSSVPIGVILALEWLMDALHGENFIPSERDVLSRVYFIPSERDVLSRVYWTDKAVFATDGYRLHVLNTRGILNGAAVERIEPGWYNLDVERNTNEVILTRYDAGDKHRPIDFAGTIKRALSAPPQKGVAVLDSLYALHAVAGFDRTVKVYVPGGGAPVSVTGTISNIDALAVIMPMAGGVSKRGEG